MAGLKTSTRLRAIMARRRRRINSSLLPENMGPQITSIHPTLPLMMSIPAAVYTRFSTSAEFLLPKAMQLATACSISRRRPGLGM